MSLRSVLRRPWAWLIALLFVGLLAGVAGPFVYINFVKPDPLDRLALDDDESNGASTSSVVAGAGTIELAGRWTVVPGDGTQAGYRVDEELFGQDTEATGRTDDVTGELTIEGTTISTATITVDLTNVTSGESRRDRQFDNRIMDIEAFPTATFELTQPIVLASEPAQQEQITVTATGNFTIRGVTNEVTFELTAQRAGNTIEATGAIPVVFADYEIPDATFGPAKVKDHGEIEFLVQFVPAS